VDYEELTIAFIDLSSGDIDQWIWDFGDGQTAFEQSPIHQYSQPGTYLVTFSVLDSSLFCTSISEQWINVADISECEAGFTVTLDTLNNTPNVYIFENTSTGNYTNLIWDFGDGSYSQESNPIHTYADSGTYEVCLSIFNNDSISCSNSYCDSLETMNYYSFGGHAFLGNYPLNIDENDSSNVAVASLFRRIENKWEFMDAREFWKYGYYWFVDKPEGDYLIRIDLMPQSEAFDTYSPAYLPKVRFWENASIFTLTNNEEFSVDLQLVEMASDKPGIGSISGFLKSDLSCFQEGVVSSQLVYLLNSENEIVAYSYANHLGEFSFEGLGFGTYQLKAEVTGKSSNIYSLTLTNENPSANDIVLEIGCESYVGTQENNGQSGIVIANVYPQPATSGLTVELKGTIKKAVNYALYNIYGVIVLSGNASGSGALLKFNMSVIDLSAGIYLLKVNEPNHSESGIKKIIIN